MISKIDQLFPISTKLNNAILHCAIPALMENIALLALAERENTLSKLSHELLSNYNLLLEAFNEFYSNETYNINYKIKLNWQALDHLLNDHDFLARQLILSPVLRLFIAKMWPHANPRYYSLQMNGGYSQLTSTEAIQFFYKPLELSVCFRTETERDGLFKETVLLTGFDSNAQITEIYFDENQENYALIKDKIPVRKEREALPPLLYEGYNYITQGLWYTGFRALQKHVHFYLADKNNQDLHQRYGLAAALIHDYILKAKTVIPADVLQEITEIITRHQDITSLVAAPQDLQRLVKLKNQIKGIEDAPESVQEHHDRQSVIHREILSDLIITVLGLAIVGASVACFLGCFGFSAAPAYVGICVGIVLVNTGGIMISEGIHFFGQAASERCDNDIQEILTQPKVSC